MVSAVTAWRGGGAIEGCQPTYLKRQDGAVVCILWVHNRGWSAPAELVHLLGAVTCGIGGVGVPSDKRLQGASSKL